MTNIQEKIILSSLVLLLITFLNFFLNIFITFFIARILESEEWGIFIFMQSMITIAVLITNFFPPAAESSSQYIIPNLLRNDDNYNLKIRAFITHVFRIRLLFSSIIFILFLIISIFQFKNNFYSITIILLPSMILIVIQNINNSIFLAYKKYKYNLLVFLSNNLIYFIGILIVFILELSNSFLYVLIFYLFSYIFSAIISLIIMLKIIPKKNKNQVKISFKDDFYKIHREYGLFLVISALLTQLTGFLINWSLFNLNLFSYITYFSICLNAEAVISRFSISNEDYYISIFSEMNIESEQFKKNLYDLNKYLSLLTCIIIAILFFSIRIYIMIIYTSRYLIIFQAIQLTIFIAYSKLILRNLGIIARSSNNTKLILKNSYFKLFTLIFFPLIGIIYFNFFVFIIFYVLFNFFTSFHLLYLINHNLKIKLKGVILFKTFFIFLISLIITYSLNLIMNSFISLNNTFMEIIINSIMNLIIFFAIFYILLYILKHITQEEFNFIINYLPFLNKRRSLEKIMCLISRLLPKEEKKNEFIIDS